MGNLQSQGGGKRHGDSNSDNKPKFDEILSRFSHEDRNNHRTTRPRNGRARSSGSLQFGMSRSEEDVREKTKEKSHSFSGLKDSLRRSFRVPSRDEQERRPKGKPKDRSQVVMGSWAGGEDAGRKKRSNSRDSGGGHRQASRTCSTGSSRSGSGRQSGGSVRRTASTGSSRRGSAGSRKSSGKRTNDGKSFISYFT
ncbi:zinc finger Ran-binding domain-containing protein 2-like isoform X1 [Branchiostoma lanceolatum]|uniref:zinc finger Ran-binding domain-containing protein 2-like isoform X1 n=1 Tax=Branchiostoma lanceolatum TaxID=7740 RepID=UPI003454C645